MTTCFSSSETIFHPRGTENVTTPCTALPLLFDILSTLKKTESTPCKDFSFTNSIEITLCALSSDKDFFTGDEFLLEESIAITGELIFALVSLTEEESGFT